ncbi:unnamed protein product [Porites lobata]|uniref:Uncharacterized protein n=1 Tax=Porites lobata TaxID=104759 RepID=A0ABN8S314_9CNID|nr:unnamed protein product [Porites lobata]
MARQKPSNSKHVLYTTQSRPKKRQGPASSPVGNGSPEQSAGSSSVTASRRPENNSPVEGAGTVEQSRTPQPARPVARPLIPTRPATSTPTRSDQILAPLDLTPVNRQQATASASREFNKQLEQRLEELKHQTLGKRSKQVQRPRKELSAHVRDVYCSLTSEDGEDVKWDLSQDFNHRNNQVVHAAIIDEVRSTGISATVSLIRAAIRTHFKTKKRQKKIKQGNKEKQVLKEQRIRSRKNTKRLKRQKALVQSTSIPNEEKRRFKDCMNVEYMSSEHSVSEDNADEENSSEDDNVPKKKVLCRRPLPWRSQELNNFFVKLDRKANRKRSQRSASMMIERKDGSPSEREAPDDAPEFALS